MTTGVVTPAPASEGSVIIFPETASRIDATSAQGCASIARKPEAAAGAATGGAEAGAAGAGDVAVGVETPVPATGAVSPPRGRNSHRAIPRTAMAATPAPIRSAGDLFAGAAPRSACAGRASTPDAGFIGAVGALGGAYFFLAS